MPIASTQPSTAPAPLRTSDSVRRSRTRSPRPAPSAARTALSRTRPVARASSRFVTLTQAISSSSPTAPSRIHSVRRNSSLAIHTSDDSHVHAEALIRRMLRLEIARDAPQIVERRVEGHLRLQAADDGELPAAAVRLRPPRRTARTPRRRRATACRAAGRRRSRSPGRRARSSARSRRDRRRSGWSRSRARGSRASSARRPSSSPGSKSRPATGRTPSARRNPTVTCAPSTRIGSPSPVTVKLAPCHAPNSANVRCASCMSQKFASLNATWSICRDGIRAPDLRQCAPARETAAA